MYELFYKFLIDELLVQYFKQTPIEAGDKFYIMIEDSALRQDFYRALNDSEYTNPQQFCFDGDEGFDMDAKTFESPVLSCSTSGVKILVSGCDNNTDGFQTKIRNSVGVQGNPLSDMAALFILPGNNAIETLLSAGKNLQERSYPLHPEMITKAINKRVNDTINDTEKEYLKQHIGKLNTQEDYSALFDFAPVLAILQKSSIKGSFNELGAFEDSEIYDNLFPISKPADRVRENTEAYAKISDIMGEAYEEDQYKRLVNILDSRLAGHIVSGKKNWKELDWSTIQKSIQEHNENAVLFRPTIKTSLDFAINQSGKPNSKTTKTHLIICDPNGTDDTLKAVFNKDLKDYDHSGEAKVSSSNLTYDSSVVFSNDRIGNEKNHHDVIVLRLRTKNIFKQIEQYFAINKQGNVVISLPDSVDSVVLGFGANEITYDKSAPVELTDDTFFKLNIDANADEEQIIPFQFGERVVKFIFKYKAEKTPTLSPAQVIDAVYGEEDGGFTHSGETGDITGTITGANNGPVYIHERFRKLVNIEKRMIDNHYYHASLEKSEFSDEDTIMDKPIDIDLAIRNSLDKIYIYFAEKQTTPSLCRPDAELIALYQSYLTLVHNYVDNIPSGSLSKQSRDMAKLGVVEHDGAILLSPFHPLMIAYAIQLAQSVDCEDYKKKVMEQLSPLFLMPYIYYGKHTMQAFDTPDTEGLLTWAMYKNVEDNLQVSGSKSISKLVSDKIKDFISHFRYYFPDADCPIRISAIGLTNSVDLIRGIVDFISSNQNKDGKVQHIEIHEYVNDMLHETFFEKINRHSSRDSISDLFDEYNFNVPNERLKEIIRLLFSRVSYFKHTYRDTRKVDGYSHIVFYKIDSGTKYTPMPAAKLRTETSLDGLVSIPSTTVDSDGHYLMGFGTNGLKETTTPIYQMAVDMNSLYAGLQNDGLVSYSKGQCTAKVYSFDDADFLNTVYQNSTWVTFINPDVDLDFFYKQDNLYVVHYVEQHSISAKLESITVTRHIDQYNNLIFNSLQTFKSVIGTSEVFSRTMINYFNCLNGKWLLDMYRKSELVIREKTSLVATCLVMDHFLKRTDGITWIPIALDEILKVTGSIGGSLDGLFSKKDLGIEGALSDDLLMMGIKEVAGELKVYIYPVEVKVLTDDSVEHGEEQVVNLCNKVLKPHLFTCNTFTSKVYRALFASQFLSNAEKLRANDLIDDTIYQFINSFRFDLLNVRFDIEHDLPEEIGAAALVVYSNGTAKTIETTTHDNVPICHIRMMERDCYRIVTNPDTQLLDFVETSIINVIEPALEVESVNADVEPMLPLNDAEEQPVSEPVADTPQELIVDVQPIEPEQPIVVAQPEKQEDEEPRIIIHVGDTKKGSAINFEPNNTDKVTHPNMGIIGTMGTGKTQFARSVIAQFAKETRHNVGGKPIGMLVFDYKGDYYQPDFLQAVGGVSYAVNFPFNPLKLIVTEKTKYMNLPSVTADRISNSFAKAYGLGQVQQSRIKQVIVDTYSQFGITRDSCTWNKPAPTLNDVVENYLAENDAKDSVYALFSKLSDYTIFTPDNSECKSMFEWLDGVRVIDLTIYPEDTKRVVVALILDLFYEEMRLLGESRTFSRYRELRAMILVDEAHQFMNKDFDSLRNIISEGRMFGVGMILSTQNLSDFKSSKLEYSKFISSWVIHQVNNITKAEIANIFGAADSNYEGYINFITNAKKFESICKLGNQVVSMHDVPYFRLIQEDERFKTSE